MHHFVVSLEPVLAVNDLEETIELYTEKLGFPLDWTYGEPLDHASVSFGILDEEGKHIHIQFSYTDKPVTFSFSHQERYWSPVQNV